MSRNFGANNFFLGVHELNGSLERQYQVSINEKNKFPRKLFYCDHSFGMKTKRLKYRFMISYGL